MTVSFLQPTRGAKMSDLFITTLLVLAIVLPFLRAYLSAAEPSFATGVTSPRRPTRTKSIDRRQQAKARTQRGGSRQ